jgi:hypothetical protein
MPRYVAKELRLEAAYLRRKAADILDHSSAILERSRQLKNDSSRRLRIAVNRGFEAEFLDYNSTRNERTPKRASSQKYLLRLYLRQSNDPAAVETRIAEHSSRGRAPVTQPDFAGAIIGSRQRAPGSYP